MKKIAIIACEPSGDLLGAELCQALTHLATEQNINIELSGVTGPLMQQAGCHSIASIDKLSVMGFSEVIARLPSILAFHYQLVRFFKQNKPDIVIGIDGPDFNLPLEKKLKKQGIYTIHYVSPTVWAWKPKRVYTVQQACHRLLVTFPFEPQYYQAINHPVDYIGHPLADRIDIAIPDAQAARTKLNLDTNKRYIALLPGSRKAELKNLGQCFLQTAELLAQKHPNLAFIAPMANSKRAQQFAELAQNFDLDLSCFTGQSAEVIRAAEAVLVTSGTATLETMLLKRPMVVAYKMSAFNYFLAKRLVKTPFIALPNIIAGKQLVPELIQEKAAPTALAEAMSCWLDQPQQVENLLNQFTELHTVLRQNASQKAAQLILQAL